MNEPRFSTWYGVVSERFPNGRVLVSSYVRINNQVYLRMTSYDAEGKETKHLDLDMRVKLAGEE
jgi:hypothetical protein